jgi:hypothetical protein
MKKGIRLLAKGGLLLVLAVGLSGCCAFNTYKPLGKAKELADGQAYAELAAMEVDCNPSCEGCNQLYLLKGDACYRQAKADIEPERHYACAVSALKKGIQLTDRWEMADFNLNRPQTYINLGESLRNLRDFRTGGEADAVNEELVTVSRAFLDAEPGNPCAIYFAQDARYTKLNRCLLRPEDCPDLCAQLEQMAKRLRQGLDAAAGSDCARQLNRLKGHVEDARQIARCP